MVNCECKYPDWQYYGRGTRMCHRCGVTQYATWVKGQGTVFLDKDIQQDTMEADSNYKERKVKRR